MDTCLLITLSLLKQKGATSLGRQNSYCGEGGGLSQLSVLPLGLRAASWLREVGLWQHKATSGLLGRLAPGESQTQGTIHVPCDRVQAMPQG